MKEGEGMRLASVALFVLVCGLSWANSKKSGEWQVVKPDKVVSDLDGFYWYVTQGGADEVTRGTARVERHEEIHRVIYSIGELTYVGAGLRTGDMLSVGWAYELDGKKFRGVSVYKIEPGPKLTGRWVGLPGTPRSWRESLSFGKALED